MLKNIAYNPLTSGLKTLFARYSNALIEKPYKTKMITTCVLTAAGDAVCQLFVEKKKLTKNYDFRRSFSLAFISGIIATPLIHLWYMRGAPAICKAVSNNTKFYPYISMIVDQTAVATSSMAMYLFLSEYFRDFNFRDAVNNVKRKWGEAIVTNWKIWPPLILLNFWIVPPHFRVFFGNFIGFFWGIYMSYFQFNK